MKTRHQHNRDYGADSDSFSRKRGPGRPPLSKKRAEDKRKNDSSSDSRHRRNPSRHAADQDTDHQAADDSIKPLDIQSTIDFDFPPTKTNETVEIQNRSKSGTFLDSFQTDLIEKFEEKFFDGESSVFVDETNWIKLSIISSFLEHVRLVTPDLPPFLIITSSIYQARWLESLNDWTTSNGVYLFKTEKKSSHEPFQIYPNSNPCDFDIMVICRDQFIRDASVLPKVAWSSVIIDDFTFAKAPLSSLMPQLNKMIFRHSIVLSADFNAMSITDLSAVQQIVKCNDIPSEKTPTIELFHEAIEGSIIRATAENVSDNFSFSAKLLCCPMTQHQQRIYNHIFSRCHDDTPIEELCKIATDLRNVSSHPLLIENSNKDSSSSAFNDNLNNNNNNNNNNNSGNSNSSNNNSSENSTSGKIILLGKILNQQKSENRRVTIVCASMKTVNLIHTSLLDHQIQHTKIDSSARIKQVSKLVAQFNNSTGFTVIIVPGALMESVLPTMNADTIVVFDIEWTPFNDPLGVVLWWGRTQVFPPKIFQLVTKGSYEKFLFEYIWRNRTVLPSEFENPNTADMDALSDLLKNSAKIAFENNETARGSSWASVLLKESPIVNFSDLTIFNSNELEKLPDNYWESINPQPPQQAQTQSEPQQAQIQQQQTQQQTQKSQKQTTSNHNSNNNNNTNNSSSNSNNKQAATRPPPPSQFWNIDRLVKVAKILDSFGIGNWELYDKKFQRPRQESTKVVALLLRHITKGINESDRYETITKFLSEFNPSDIRFSLPAISEIDECLNPLMLLQDIELIAHLQKIVPNNATKSNLATTVSLEGRTSEPLSDEWTDSHDRELLYSARKYGLMKIPKDFYPEYSHFFVDRTRNIIQEITKYEKEIASKPTVISLRKPRIFSQADHTKIVNALMSFGFPSIEEFASSIDLQQQQGHMNHHQKNPSSTTSISLISPSSLTSSPSQDSINRYVKYILRYCAASIEDRRSILPLLAEKIQKYAASKIPQRVALFQQIRESVEKTHDFPAEDLEILSAIAFHGFINYSVSPILNVVCFGNCTEIKLNCRVKAIFSEKHRGHFTQRIPSDLRQRLPLKINDMMVLTELGEITGFHTPQFIYPVNYQCAVVANSPIRPDVQIWILCTITERTVKTDKNEQTEGNELTDKNENVEQKKIPWFIVEPKDSKDFRFEGESPNKVFADFRTRMIKSINSNKTLQNTIKFVPPFDGHEMFGLHSAFVHRIFIDMPGIEKCENYERRFFKGGFNLTSKWPTIGQFEKEPDKQQLQQQQQTGTVTSSAGGKAQKQQKQQQKQQQIVAQQQQQIVVQQQASKFKYKRKMFGDILQPLVFDFMPLFSQEKSGLVVDLRISGVNCADMVDNYMLWNTPINMSDSIENNNNVLNEIENKE